MDAQQAAKISLEIAELIVSKCSIKKEAAAIAVSALAAVLEMNDLYLDDIQGKVEGFPGVLAMKLCAMGVEGSDKSN